MDLQKHQKSVESKISDDLKSVEKLFYLYQDKVYGFALQSLKSDSLAKDILQEVFLRLCQKKDELTRIDNYDTYIFFIARNLIVDHVRKVAKEKSSKEEMWRNIENRRVCKSDILVAKELESQIKNGLEKLTPQQQLIFKLSREEGLSHRLIAKKLNLSQNTVKNHLVNALKTLRNIIPLDTYLIGFIGLEYLVHTIILL